MAPLRGTVIDVGAAGDPGGEFEFARRCLAAGAEHVIAVDPLFCGQPVRPPAKVTVVRAAVVPYPLPHWECLVVTHPPKGSYLGRFPPARPECQLARRLQAPVVDLEELMSRFRLNRAALIKMDCEGAEGPILKSWPGPVADQVSVEFHDHLGFPGDPPDHFLQWYRPVRHRAYRRRGRVAHWDSLFVLKDQYRC